MGETVTPSFKSPPVIETVLGVQFKPLEKWSIPHFGLYWNKVRNQFPKTEIKPTLSIDTPQAGVHLQFMAAPEVRCWYLSNDESELVQIQNDRFVVNWRQTSDTQVYPRYHKKVRPFFDSQWRAFKSFLHSESLEKPVPISCELAYVNHILKGEGWDSAADWDQIFSVCGNVGGGDKFLPAPEARQFAFNYPMPDGLGTLDVNAVRAIRQRDGKDVIQFRLSAKGRPTGASDAAVMEWFDRGHEWVVKGFAELTSSKMHSRWGRE